MKRDKRVKARFHMDVLFTRIEVERHCLASILRDARTYRYKVVISRTTKSDRNGNIIHRYKAYRVYKSDLQYVSIHKG